MTKKPSHDVQNGDKANRDGFGLLDKLMTTGSGMLQRTSRAMKAHNKRVQNAGKILKKK